MTTRQPYKISFCTTCMDRLYHLKETLPQNLISNAPYANIEFVVLNYNSKDEIDSWIKKEMMVEIRNQKLKYIKTIEPLYFKVSHAKNIVSKFASGDIICNVDADNFTGVGFAEYINEQFTKENNILLTGGMEGYWDTIGRACFWKSDFLKVRGYDERILDWGYEDFDLYHRIHNEIGRHEVKINNIKYLRTIKHDESVRMKNGFYGSEIEFGLILENQDIVKSYILKKNNQFEHLTTTTDSKSSFNHGALINKEEMQYGQWLIKGDIIQFKDHESITILSTEDGGKTYLAPEGIYRRITKDKVSIYYSSLKGRQVFHENINMKHDINVKGFGECSVFEPFF